MKQETTERKKEEQDRTEYEILPATEADRDQVLALYQEQKGKEYCPWSDEYPGNETIDFDLSRDALYVMKEKEKKEEQDKGKEKDKEEEKDKRKILAAVSLDEDEDVNRLDCWDPAIAPGGELARLAVRRDMQNRGLARILLDFGMREWFRRGKKSIHFLVNRHNVKAIRSYAAFGFHVVGECEMFDQEFLCYEISKEEYEEKCKIQFM